MWNGFVEICGLPVRSVLYVYTARRLCMRVHPVEVILYSLPWKRIQISCLLYTSDAADDP